MSHPSSHPPTSGELCSRGSTPYKEKHLLNPSYWERIWQPQVGNSSDSGQLMISQRKRTYTAHLTLRFEEGAPLTKLHSPALCCRAFTCAASKHHHLNLSSTNKQHYSYIQLFFEFLNPRCPVIITSCTSKAHTLSQRHPHADAQIRLCNSFGWCEKSSACHPATDKANQG